MISKIKAAIVSLSLSLFVLTLMAPQFSIIENAIAKEPLKSVTTEIRGQKQVDYLVNDINKLKRPYNYTISKTTFAIIEIAGVLAIIGALLFGFGHGFGRFLGTKKTPIELELHGSEYIYAAIMRIGHWLNALMIVILIISGFLMHYMGPRHTLGYIHNFAGNTLVGIYVIFLIYEIATKDFKQFLPQVWEIKEGMFKQAMFYAIGIFKREEHPYHMTREARLNPMQKPAYMGIMFGVLPLVIITGFLMANPLLSAPVIKFIGLENMNIVFIIHLVAAFAIFAFLVGHIYLATTGDTVLQHFEVMITGKHKHYSYKRPGEDKQSSSH